MTDEERRKLCNALRSCPEDTVEIIALMRMAANEIERLARRIEELEIRIELMESDAMGDDA
jgi:hypothetical protein